MYIFHLELISTWTAHVLLSSHMQLVAVILDSAGLRSSSEKRVLWLPCQSQVTGHPLHSLVNFKVAILLPWKTFPNFRITFKPIYPRKMWLLSYVLFACLFSILGSFRNMFFLPCFPRNGMALL